MFLLFNSAAHILMPGVYTQLSPHETCLVGLFHIVTLSILVFA